MQLEEAEPLARQLLDQLRPYCIRAEVAGSIRRRKDDVKDIELLAIPRWEERPATASLFNDETIAVNLLHEWATGPGCHVQWIKPGTPDVMPWQVGAHGKYWRGLLAEGIKLDLFIATPDNWGILLLIRTGSAAFSQEVMLRAKRQRRPCVSGFLTRGGQSVATPEEIDAFNHLRLRYVEPEQRMDERAVQPLTSNE